MKRSIGIGGRRYDITSDDQYLAGMPEEFEPDMVALFRALVGPQDVVADVGANIGMTALLFSTLARQVHAFEAAPSTHAILQANLAAAGVANVEAVNLGLGSADAELTVTFATSNRAGGFISSSVRPDQGHTTEKVQIRTLDGYFWDRAPRPSFVKMDVEGFEPEVIRGGRNLIAQQKPTVVLELNHFCLNVLQRVSLPVFFDQLRATFPVLYAVEAGNRAIADLHHPDSAYAVMYHHVLRFSYPNIVGGFDPALGARLSALAG